MEQQKNEHETRLSESRASSKPDVSSGRISCDACRRQKIKCEREGNSCLRCINKGLQCETSFAKKQRRKKSKHGLLQVESRIQRLESALTASGIDTHFPYKDNDDVRSTSSADLDDRLSTLLIDETGSSRFVGWTVGASSGFSLYSPQGLDWIAKRTGSSDLSQLVFSFAREGEASSPMDYAEWWHPLPPSEREPLPPKEVADQYVECFFDTFNSTFPLFDRKTFNEYFERQYSGQSPGGVAWYASLNIVISLGMIIQQTGLSGDSCGTCFKFDEEQSWKYFRNACSCVVDLMFKECNLLAVQAICGMAFLQQITSDSQSVYILTAAAGRLAYAIGLHEKLDRSGLSQAEIVQRCKVFWIVYFLDKNIALRLGHPSIISDDDIGVDLPQGSSSFQENPNGFQTHDMFRYQSQLALLESRIYIDLYSIRSRKKSRLQRLISVETLDNAIQEWRLALPVEIRPGETIQCTEELFVPVTMIHLEYFNCLATLHRSSVQYASKMTSDVGLNDSISCDQKLESQVRASQSNCLRAARNSIQLILDFDYNRTSGRTSLMMTSYYALSSFTTLFANTLQNPQDACAISDLKLMEFVISLLSPVMIRSFPFPASTAIKVFQELNNVASKFVQRVNLPHGMQERDEDDESKLNSNTAASMISSTYEPNPNPPLATYTPLQYTSITQPQQDVDQHHQLQPLYPFGSDGMAMPADSYPVPPNETSPFVDFFERDLANIWNHDYMQDSWGA